MGISALTNKEKIVFFNLVKHPGLNDIELAEKTGIKRSTVTAIKNRLKAEKYFTTVIVPNFPFFGVKVMSILYAKFNPKYPREERTKSAIFHQKLEHPELVFLQTSDTECVLIYLSDQLTDIRRSQDYFILDYEAHDFFEDVQRIYYPLDLCDLHSFLDFSDTLARLFGMKNEKQETRVFWKEKSKTALTNTEKKILSAIIKYPEANNIEISKKTDKTRSTVSKVRKKLISESLVRVVNIPALDKLGCELMVFSHFKFNPKSNLKDRSTEIDLTMKTLTPIFHISGDMENSDLLIFRNYTEYVDLFNKILAQYKEKNLIQGSPYLLFFPFQQLKWTKLDFASLIEKLLFGEHKQKEKATKAKAES